MTRLLEWTFCMRLGGLFRRLPRCSQLVVEAFVEDGGLSNERCYLL